MKTPEKKPPRPDKRLAAVCGLFCPACRVFIATREDPERLKLIAKRFGISVEEAQCDGCRTERRLPYCRDCKMVRCAAEKGLDFCGECAEYPCEDLRKFQEELPHRIELWKNQERIKEVGYEKWFEEMVGHYTCSPCGTINSAYDLTCRECGADPSCAYVGQHREKIIPFLPQRK